MHKLMIKTLFGLSVIAGTVAAATPAHATKLVNLATGYCLSTKAAGISNGTPITVRACDGSANQQWTKGPAFTTDQKYGANFFQYLNGALSTSCLGVSAASTSDGAPLVLWSCVAPGRDQFWATAKDTATGCYIFHDLNSGLVMGVSGGSPQQGAQVIQWDDLHTQAGHRDQEWCEQ